METKDLITKEILLQNDFVLVPEYKTIRWMTEQDSRFGGDEISWNWETKHLAVRTSNASIDIYRCERLTQMNNVIRAAEIEKEIIL